MPFDKEWWMRIVRDELQTYVEKYGVSDLEKFFKEKLEHWKNIKVNIAITGEAGAGKSSFINKIREIKDYDPEAAKVGSETDCTNKPHRYPYPKNPNIIFWDLPGIGTSEFPAEEYGHKVDLPTYDMFLIFMATRIPKNISILAEAISSIGKKFFFVRSKMDQDISNEISSNKPGSISEKGVLEKVRNDCLKTLGEQMSNKQDIFLISSKDTTKGEFEKLVQAILDVLSTKDKRECLTLSLGILKHLSTETLERKVEVLEGRICLVAAASAAVALVPIPGVSAAADLGLIVKELDFYRSQLGLPDESSETFKRLTGATKVKVKKAFSILETASKGAGWLAAYATGTATEEGVRLFLPLIGLVVASALSFGTTYLALNDCLKTMKEAAFAVLNEVALKSTREAQHQHQGGQSSLP